MNIDYHSFFLERLSHRISKQEVLEICNDVLEHPESFTALIDFVKSEDDNQSFMASWVMTHVIDQQKDFIQPFIISLVKHLTAGKANESTRRNILRSLEKAAFPDSIKTNMIDLCYKYLISKEQPLAVKAFAMTIFYNCAYKEKDLLLELKLLLEEQLDIQSSGFKNRANKLITKIDKHSLRK